MVDWDAVARKARTPWEAGLWSEESCKSRMQRAVEKFELYPGSVILDWGCAVGYLSRWLPEDVEYLGVDQSHDMIKRARRENPDREFRHTSNFVRDMDYSHVAALGPWNLRDGWTREQTWEQVAGLWVDLSPDVMVVSLFAGRNETGRHIVYTAEEVAWQAERLASTWEVARWRPNDLMLVMRG